MIEPWVAILALLLLVVLLTIVRRREVTATNMHIFYCSGACGTKLAAIGWRPGFGEVVLCAKCRAIADGNGGGGAAMSTPHAPETCPMCDEGQLSRPIAVQECNSCNSHVALPDLVAMNYRMQHAEQQRDELLDVLADAVSALEVCGKDYRVTEIARELIAKHRGQQS